jgi:HD-GYP domain-containing protein (c-di-GMP phosphodiesterase class II)
MSSANQSKAADTAPVPMGIPARMLRPATFPPFDIYVRTDGNGDFQLFRRANEPVYANTWEKLEAGGFDTVYVRGNTREACLDYVEENLPAVLDEDALPPAQTAEWAYRVARRTVRALLDDPDSFRAHKRVRQMAGCLARLIRGDGDAKWALLDCAPQAYATEAHSVNLGVLLASFASLALGARDDDLLAQIALGGLLHDVGKALIAPEILDKPGDLTRKEFAQIKKHPRYGLKVVRPHLRDSSIGRCIIGQHHENVSGDGYPEGRSGDGINVFARAARIADVFDAMTSDRPYRRGMDDFHALSTMVGEMRGQLDIAMLRKFIRFMGSQPGETAAPTAVAEPEPAPEAEPETESVVLTAPTEEKEEAVEAPELAPEPMAEAEAAEAEPAPARVARTVVRLEPIDDPVEPVAPPAPRVSPNDATVLLPLGQEPPAHKYAAEPEPMPRSDEETEVAIELQATLEEKREAIQDLSDEQAETTALMAGLLEALRKGIGAPLGQSVRADAAGDAEARPAPTGVRSAREVEEALVRSLFPLIWQIDEWSGQFVPMPNQSPETAAACADALSCLRALRKGLVSILGEHHVEVIEDAAASGGAQNDSGRVTRVGFLYTGGEKDEVIEPARVVLYPDLRRAG